MKTPSVNITWSGWIVQDIVVSTTPGTHSPTMCHLYLFGNFVQFHEILFRWMAQPSSNGGFRNPNAVARNPNAVAHRVAPRRSTRDDDVDRRSGGGINGRFVGDLWVWLPVMSNYSDAFNQQLEIDKYPIEFYNDPYKWRMILTLNSIKGNDEGWVLGWALRNAL